MIRLTITVGTMHDYRGLAHHHYLPKPPRVIDRIFIARGVDGPAGGMTLGVLVLSYPIPRCAARNRVLAARYEGLSASTALRRLNADVRTIGRVIVHTAFRGLGVGTQLARHAIDHATTPYLESLAAMGASHRFLERAGMRAVSVPPARHQQDILRAIRAAGVSDRIMLNDDERIVHLDALTSTQRRSLRAALDRWHAHRKGRCASAMTMDHALVAAIADLWRTPTYFMMRTTAHDSLSEGGLE